MTHLLTHTEVPLCGTHMSDTSELYVPIDYRVNTYPNITVCPGSSDPPEKYLIYLHQKMRFRPFINYYDTLGEYYSFTEQNNCRSHEFNWTK